MNLARCFAACLYSLRRHPLPRAHLAISSGTALVFLLYYAYTPWAPLQKVLAYVQVQGCAMPFLIGLFAALLAEHEFSAGCAQNLLGAPHRVCAFLARLLVLLVLGLGALLLAGVLFGWGWCALLGHGDVPLTYFIQAPLLIAYFSLPVYLLCWLLALRFGQSASIGAGTLLSLIAALFLTGMGDGLWQVTLAAWTPRVAGLWLAHVAAGAALPKDAQTAAVCCLLCSSGLLLWLLLWCRRWDGRKSAGDA